jgi:hypothetical protein
MKITTNSSYEEVLNALMIDGNQLQFANNDFKDNYELCYAAISQNFSAIRFCSNRLKSNSEIALHAISKSSLSTNDGVNGSVIFNEIISETFRVDLDFIFEAYIANPIYIRPPEYLLNEMYFMLQVVRRNGMLIRDASLNIKQNRQIVLAAANQSGDFFCNSGFEIFWNDREIALAVAKTSWWFPPCIPSDFITWADFLDAIISNAKNLKKILEIPKEIFYSKNGILEIKKFSNCYFSLEKSADKFLLLQRLLDYEFLTKEVIEKLKIESVNRDVNVDMINLFLKFAKRKGVMKFE